MRHRTGNNPRTQSKTNAKPSIFAAVGLAGITATAGAQCRVLSSTMPDFDQRRTALGNNGSWFCVPTAACNVMAYLQNTSEMPNNLFGGVVKDWQPQSVYGEVSGRIAEMGVLMSTSPTGGTVGSGITDGLQAWLDTYAPDEFTIGGYYPSSTTTPTVGQLSRARGVFGRENMVNVVYYEKGTGNFYNSYGGHEVTLRWFDPCLQQVGIRDPWTSADESMTAQSPFTTVPTGIEPVSSSFNGQSMTLNRLPGYDPDGFWWGTTTVGRKFCWAFDIKLTVPKFKLLIPNLPEIYGIDPVREFSLPLGQVAVTSIVPSADLLGAYVTTRASGLVGAQVLWHFDPSNGHWTQVVGVDLPDAAEPDAVIEVDRFNNLYVADNKVLRRYSLGADGKTPFPLGSVNLGAHIGDLVMGDGSAKLGPLSTKIWALQPEAGKLAVIESDLSSSSNRTLPLAVAADASISVHPNTNEMFLAGGTGGGIHRLAPSLAAAVWTITESLSNTAIQNPQSLEVLPSGAVMFRRGTSTIVLTKVGSNWKRLTSTWDGLSVAGEFRVGRSRTNFQPGVHDGPGFAEIEPLHRSANPIADCAADINGDDFANGDDFDTFVAWFVAGVRAADFNQDGFVTGDDFDAFVEAFVAGC